MLQVSGESNFWQNLMHDLSSPLTYVRLNLDALTLQYQNKRDAKALELVKSTISGIDQVTRLITSTRETVKIRDIKPGFNAVKEIYEITDIFNIHLRQLQIKLVFNLAYDHYFPDNRIIFARILSNIVNNAVQAQSGCVRTEKKLIIKTFLKSGYFNISLTDNGQGIKAQHLHKIFNYGFTTKVKGTGIGLNEAREYMQKYFHGEIEVLSRYKHWTKVILKFPLDK